MRVVQLSDSLSVSEQITVQDVARIAEAGFKVLINNRPDYEVPDQPASEEISAAAKAAGLDYYHLPMTAQNFPGLDLDKLATLINDPARPALAFCRSGTRCTNLWVAACDKDSRGNSTAIARQLGYDLSMVLSH